MFKSLSQRLSQIQETFTKTITDLNNLIDKSSVKIEEIEGEVDKLNKEKYDVINIASQASTFKSNLEKLLSGK